MIFAEEPIATARLTRPGRRGYTHRTAARSRARQGSAPLQHRGSVDDGKSTLIGRLLYDSQNVYEDHVAPSPTTPPSISHSSQTPARRTRTGITIDVAYRISHRQRKFIIAIPRHEQYTRNMATAHPPDVAIVLVDARKGILNQTRRHACHRALLEFPRSSAINKMDLVDSPRSFSAIAATCLPCPALDIPD